MTKSEIRDLKLQRQQKRRLSKGLLPTNTTTVVAAPHPPAAAEAPAASAPPPHDLANLLVEVERPEDVDNHAFVQQFRRHLEKQDREGILDFAIACNVLRLRESEIKALKVKDQPRSGQKLDAINGERLELLQAIGQIFFLDGCVQPIVLNNRVLGKALFLVCPQTF